MLSTAAQMPTTSYSPNGGPKGNVPRPVLPAEVTNSGHGNGENTGPSSSWISSLRRISSSK